MVLILKNKDECKIIMNKIKLFLKDILHLKLNDKSRYYPRSMGVNFCGYRIYECYRLVRNRCKKEIRKKIKLWSRGNVDILHMRLSYNSWLSHVKHACSYNLVSRYELKIMNYILK